jgi:hypothetical protein
LHGSTCVVILWGKINFWWKIPVLR